MKRELGKIESIKLGYGGYQDAQFGISFTLSGEEWISSSNKYIWALDMECSDHHSWTEEDRNQIFAEIMRYINQLMIDAKVRNIKDLKGIPIEAEFEAGLLKSWRILKEVL